MWHWRDSSWVTTKLQSLLQPCQIVMDVAVTASMEPEEPPLEMVKRCKLGTDVTLCRLPQNHSPLLLKRGQ